MLTPDSLEAIHADAVRRLTRPVYEQTARDCSWLCRFAQLGILTAGRCDPDADPTNPQGHGGLAYAVPDLWGKGLWGRSIALSALRTLRRSVLVRSWGQGRRLRILDGNERWTRAVDDLGDWLAARLKGKGE